MQQFVAMLRGINVAGHKSTKMETVRACFLALGFNGVQTYVQSGNVMFRASGLGVPALVKQIEKKLLRDLGFQVPVLLRLASDLSRTVKRNPFLRDQTVDPSKLYVTFLSEAPTAEATRSLERLRSGPDRFQLMGREIYLHCPQGYGRTKLSNTTFERLLSVKATTRNWTTVNKVLEMVS